MNPHFGARRRADEFDRLLSGPASARQMLAEPPAGSAFDAERYDELLALVATLRDVTPAEPRPAFSAHLRSRLMLAAEGALTPDTAEQSAARRAPAIRRSPRERRLVAAVGGFAIVSATASMAVAAQSALPGDTLYPLKRAIENAQTGVQRDADGKGTTLLVNATGRLDEVGALSRSGDDADAIALTLHDFVDQAQEASALLLGDFASNGQASTIEELRAFTADSMGILTRLQSVIPETARASLIEATQVINAIDVQAQALCPACTDLPIIQAPVFATKSIDALLDDARGPVADAVLAPVSATSDDAPTSGSRGTKGSKGSKGSDGAKGEQEAEESSTPSVPTSAPQEPSLPQGPSSSDSDDKDDEKKKDGVLDGLNVNRSDDPIGDLLTGTAKTAGKAVDDVVKGVTGLGN
ncbi:DUF5667 domain-containing protein [Nocardioides sp.]|uniref:DUF5667 domain-containing protein n=1 Tax=Nocardioides sp. TaxID=35761 RepID=UPI002B2714B3|nr:DUF5667 domain-containing protein [Nocardioides sp.]